MTFGRGTRILAVLGSLGLAAGLGACTTGGDAVESMGVSYSENDVTVAVRDLNDLLGAGSVTRQDTVAFLAQVQPLITVAEENGLIDPTEEYLNQAAQEILVQISPEGDVTTMSPAARDILAAQAVNGVLSQAVAENPDLSTEIFQRLQQPSTMINPRYLSVTEQGMTAPTLLGDVVDTTSSPLG